MDLFFYVRIYIYIYITNAAENPHVIWMWCVCVWDVLQNESNFPKIDQRKGLDKTESIFNIWRRIIHVKLI